MSDPLGTPSRVDFGRIAEDYEVTRGIPEAFMNEIIEDIIHTCKLTSTSLVLELGCGAGRFLRALASRKVPVLGLDISKGMLEKACSNQRSSRFLRSNLVSGDAVAIPMNQGTFTAVMAIHFFHLLSDWRDAINETVHVLGSGGTIVTGYVESHTSQSSLHQLCRKRRDELGYSAEPLGAHPPEVISELKKQGASVTTHNYQTSIDVPLSVTLSYLERRVFSSTWRNLPDVVYRQIMQNVREAATSQFKNLDDVEHLQIAAELHFITFK